MLAYDPALRLLPPAPQDISARGGGASGANAQVIGARLRAAARVVCDDPDAAALLLDGAIAAIAALWLARASVDVPAPALWPAQVDCGDPLFGLRLRLALRARNVEARLVHCRELLRLIEEDDKGDEHHVG